VSGRPVGPGAGKGQPPFTGSDYRRLASRLSPPAQDGRVGAGPVAGGVPEDAGHPRVGPEGCEPGPLGEACDRAPESLAVGRHALAHGVRVDLPTTRHLELPGSVQAADGPRPSVPVEAPGKVLRLGVASHADSSASEGVFPAPADHRGLPRREPP